MTTPSPKQLARTAELERRECDRCELVARHMGKAVSDITEAERAEAAALLISLPQIPTWTKLPARKIVR